MKVGIITMHRVKNFGSVLQSYALLKKIEEEGVECEIIDYVFKKVTSHTIIDRLQVWVSLFKDKLSGSPRARQKIKFDNFIKTFYRLSERSYSYSELQNNPPSYDIYMAGSDQVWNPRHVLSDDTFLLSFVKDAGYKCSYSSSFATTVLPVEYLDLYKKNLSNFSALSVREQSSVELVQNLIGKIPQVCVDPTMLLSNEHWSKLAQMSGVKIKGRYILVYALYYMFDPYPELKRIIDNVQSVFGCQVIFLNGRKSDYLNSNSSVLKDCGPLDFLSLIKNAEFVITTSFHGSLFSLLLDTPVMGIVQSNNINDDRLTSLFMEYGTKESIVSYNSLKKWSKEELIQMRGNQNKIIKRRNESINYLRKILKR